MFNAIQISVFTLGSVAYGESAGATTSVHKKEAEHSLKSDLFFPRTLPCQNLGFLPKEPDADEATKLNFDRHSISQRVILIH